MASGLEAVFAQGAAALDAGDLPGAEQIFRSIIEADPRAHPAWNALSVVAVRAGFPELAAERARHALELDRRNAVYLNSLGVALGELGLFAESEDAFRRALKAKPAYVEGLFNLGKVLHKRGRLAEALRAYERVYAMDRRFPGVLLALIGMLRKHGRAERALEVLLESAGGLELDDLCTLQVELIAELEGVEAALTWQREKLAQNSALVGAHFSIAQLLLGMRRWREGWHEYLLRPVVLKERVDPADYSLRLPAPMPAQLDGRSVRLRRDQGIGDSLFFLRFAPELQRRGATVSVMAPRNLAAVLGDGAIEVMVEEEPAATRSWDYDVWISDLPALLETDAVPPAFPLRADKLRLERQGQALERLGPPPYLGLTWRAGVDTLRMREFGNERAFLYKEVPPPVFGQALRGWRGTLLALQREPYAGEIDAVAKAAGAPVHDLSVLNGDLPQMLALLSLLDDYVTVSNTNVHLHAGLGRTARVLVPYPPEWRWTFDGESPWFPGFPVYRQPQPRGWDKPLGDLRKDLSL